MLNLTPLQQVLGLCLLMASLDVLLMLVLNRPARFWRVVIATLLICANLAIVLWAIALAGIANQYSYPTTAVPLWTAIIILAGLGTTFILGLPLRDKLDELE